MNMNIELLTEAEIATLRENITNANRIVICCHKSPDGDALGSSLAWAEYLRTQGKDPEIIVPDAYPDFLQWLPGSERIIRYDKHAADKADALLKEAELIFCLDFNGTDRVDEMRDALEQSPASKIMIDHHLDPRMDTVLTVSFPHISSTSELVFRIIWQMGGFEEMSRKCAACIYCGMMTDTGGFIHTVGAIEVETQRCSSS